MQEQFTTRFYAEMDLEQRQQRAIFFHCFVPLFLSPLSSQVMNNATSPPIGTCATDSKQMETVVKNVQIGMVKKMMHQAALI